MPRRPKGHSMESLATQQTIATQGIATQGSDVMTSLHNVQQAMLACFQSPDFSVSVKNAVKPLLDNLQQQIATNNTLIKGQQKQIKEHEFKLHQLERKIQEQEIKLNTCQQKVNAEDRKKRMEILRVEGLPQDLKSAEEKFVEIIKEKMKIDLNSSNAEHPEVVFYEENRPTNPRPGEMKQNGKSIKIVKFTNIWKRREVYNLRSQLKNTEIFLNEDLDREERQIFYQCRMLKKQGKITATWTKEMKIIVKTNDGETVVLETRHHLQELKERIQKNEGDVKESSVHTDQTKEDYENLFKE